MAPLTAAQPKSRKNHALATPTDLSREGVSEICESLRGLLADVFALYVKTKNFHWHMSGPHFRDYHLMLDEQSDQIFAMTDDIAERARKIGGTTLHSIGEIAKHQRLKDNNAEFVAPQEMLAELCADNQQLTESLREAHEVCDRHNDVATTSLIEVWIDQTERRTWFLFEASTER
ncbi:MAG TPA: DNA starvation/stationary phase protection protein [Pirellulales bacterium]|jgi:starvation-inducible DNA-binding protein|nr:DNA starvation/stationary phase protection protein [Pirellulales bacterium]